MDTLRELRLEIRVGAPRGVPETEGGAAEDGETDALGSQRMAVPGV